ncbi:MAG TPA: hypothetical protein VHA12_02370 [Candidatus Nanoarchaeia archaeon]|nr:hypothetical protein [Candidatus Nanoarchaeia archaeon]
MSSEINDPKKFRSANQIIGDVENYKGPSQQIGYIERTLKSLEKGDIVTVKSVRLKLGDMARALYENAEPAMQRSLSNRMRYIAENAREFARTVNEEPTAKTYDEFLEKRLVSPNDHEADARIKLLKSKSKLYNGSLTDKVSAVAVYAGLASTLVFFSASSITGNVVLDVSNNVFSRGAIALGIGLLVIGLSVLFSRKR